MGCYQIWQIEFLDKKSRKYFESLKLHTRILCSYCYWNDKEILKHKRTGEVTYFMRYFGYAEAEEILSKHLKKINVKKFYSLDLSCRMNWYNELREFKKMEESNGKL